MTTAAGSPTRMSPVVVDVIGAAQYLGINARTLDNWRSQGRGPRFVRVGRRIVYRVRDIEAYLDAGTVEPASLR